MHRTLPSCEKGQKRVPRLATQAFAKPYTGELKPFNRKNRPKLPEVQPLTGWDHFGTCESGGTVALFVRAKNALGRLSTLMLTARRVRGRKVPESQWLS